MTEEMKDVKATPKLDSLIEQLELAAVDRWLIKHADPIWFDLLEALKEIRSMISEVKQ